MPGSRREDSIVWLARPSTLSPRAPATAEITSEEGSFIPRSTSDRYCMLTPAASATSLNRSPRPSRTRRNSRPINSRHNGSGNRVRAARCSNVTTSPISARYPSQCRGDVEQAGSTAGRHATLTDTNVGRLPRRSANSAPWRLADIPPAWRRADIPSVHGVGTARPTLGALTGHGWHKRPTVSGCCSRVSALCAPRIVDCHGRRR